MISRGLVYSSRRMVTPYGSTAPAANVLAMDSSRYKNNGTETSVTYSQLPSGLWVFNQNAQTDRINLGTPTSILFTYHSFSTAIWINFTDLSYAGGSVFFCRGVQNVDGWFIFIDTNARFYIDTLQAGATQASGTAVGTITTNKWLYLATTRNGSSCRVFLNGIDSTSFAGVHVDPLTSARNTYIGCYEGAAGGITGSYALPRIWNRPLSSTEIRKIFESERQLFGV